MAIVSVRAIGRSNRGRRTSEYERSYTTAFRVITSAVTDGLQTVLLAPTIPRVGVPYQYGIELDTGALCQDLEGERDDEDPLVWYVFAHFETRFPNKQSPEDQNENPLLRPSKIKWGFAKFQRPVERALPNAANFEVAPEDGKPIINSAGDPFDPPYEIEDSRPTLAITRNEALDVFQPSVAVDYQDAVNADAFFGAAPGKAKVMGISAERDWKGTYPYWIVTYDFEFRREGWQLKVLNRGYNQIDTAGALVACRTADGSPVSSPIPLNVLGRQLSPGGTLIYLDFTVYKSLPFGALGLP